MKASAMPREHSDALNRKNIIEKRKEETERREQDKAREEARWLLIYISFNIANTTIAITTCIAINIDLF